MVSATPLATRVAMRNMEAVDDVCRSSFGCGGVDLATITLISLTAVLALLVITTIVHVWDAETLLDEEMRRLAAERRAFSEFSKRVADIEVAETTATAPASGGLITTTTNPDNRLNRVREAYRETVMDVPHFEEDYGESLGENLAVEFGDGLAVAVVDGSQFTPQLKAALVQSSHEASQRRASFISTLKAEADALEESVSALKELDTERELLAESPLPSRSYEELVGDWHHLDRLSDRCDGLISERQRQLGELSASLPAGSGEIHEYLYDELPVSHPVLADAASLFEAIKELQGEVLRSITRRV